jgi:GMP synthase-like glutamine amidotransferase
VRVLAFRHVPFEGLGLIESALEARGIHFDYCDLYQPAAVMPEANRYDGLIFMGGPMSVNDEPAFLLEEMRLIERAAARGVPMLGVCLGSQMIARALGGRVYRNSEKEIGWFDVHLTEDGRRDPMLGQLAPVERVFHWHGDTFDLPPEAVWLAWSQRTARQAYRIGRAIYGLQFHLEVTPAMIVNWSVEDDNCGDVRELSAPLDPWLNYARCCEVALPAFSQWCDMVAPAAGTARRA